MKKKLPKILFYSLVLFSILQTFGFLFVNLVDIPVSAAEERRNPFDDLNVEIPGLVELARDYPMKCINGADGKPVSCSMTWLAVYVASIYKYAVGVVGILAAVIMMVGGIMWIVAGGNATRIGEAKAWITAAVTGLILALTSYTILYQVNPDLVSFEAMEIGIVPDIKPEDIKFWSGGGAEGVGNVTKNIDAYDTYLKNAADEFGVDCTLLKAIMYTESGGSPSVVSYAGAVGLMQLMPATAEWLGVSRSSLTDPATNIYAGAKYVNKMQTLACNNGASNSVCNTSQDDYTYIIASYNGGPGSNKPSKSCPGQTWWQCKVNKGYAQTRNYVSVVQANIRDLESRGWGCRDL